MILLRDEWGLSAREVFDGLPDWEVAGLQAVAEGRQKKREAQARQQG